MELRDVVALLCAELVNVAGRLIRAMVGPDKAGEWGGPGAEIKC